MPIVQLENLIRWLESYRERQRNLESTCERLGRLEARLTSPRSAALSGMPGAAVTGPDRLAFPLAELEELRQEIEKQAESLRDLRHRIEGAVRLISGPAWPDKRAVLRLRYLDGETWLDISEILFGRMPQFEMNRETYLRRAFKLRKSALKVLAEHPKIDEFMKEENDV